MPDANKMRLTFILMLSLSVVGLAASDTALTAVFFAAIVSTAVMALIWGAE